jgi:hypothetical protein
MENFTPYPCVDLSGLMLCSSAVGSGAWSNVADSAGKQSLTGGDLVAQFFNQVVQAVA